MSATETLSRTRRQLKSLGGAIPGTTSAFGALGKSVKSDGALTFREKELVALGIAVAIRCEPCILVHMETLIKLGTPRVEIADCLSVTIQMAGGPGLMYAAKALAIYDDLADPTGSAP